jgi:hypothetical protein
MAKAVIGMIDRQEQVELTVTKLQAAGFALDDISVLFPDKGTTRDFAFEKGTKAPEGAVAGVSAGGVVGGTIGLLAGIGAIAIPGVGPLIAAGPLLAALGGAAAGAAVGGVAGALVGFGIPELEARRYEGKLKSGGILLAVHTDSHDELKRAEQILKGSGATDVSSTREVHVPKEQQAHR